MTIPEVGSIVNPVGVGVSVDETNEKTKGDVPPVRVNAAEERWTPCVVVIFEPPLTTITWLTKMVMTL